MLTIPICTKFAESWLTFMLLLLSLLLLLLLFMLLFVFEMAIIADIDT